MGWLQLILCAIISAFSVLKTALFMTISCTAYSLIFHLILNKNILSKCFIETDIYHQLNKNKCLKMLQLNIFWKHIYCEFVMCFCKAFKKDIESKWRKMNSWKLTIVLPSYMICFVFSSQKFGNILLFKELILGSWREI